MHLFFAGDTRNHAVTEASVLLLVFEAALVLATMADSATRLCLATLSVWHSHMTCVVLCRNVRPVKSLLAREPPTPNEQDQRPRIDPVSVSRYAQHGVVTDCSASPHSIADAITDAGMATAHCVWNQTVEQQIATRTA